MACRTQLVTTGVVPEFCGLRLRYPSRFPPQRAKPQTSSRRPSRSFSVPAPEGRLRDGRPARPDSHTSHATHAWMQATLQTPEPLEPCQTSSTSDDVQVMKDFVKNEEARLRALSHGGARPLDPDPGSYRLSWEEQPAPRQFAKKRSVGRALPWRPRAALPFKAKRAKSRAKSRAFGGQASEPPALPEEECSGAAWCSACSAAAGGGTPPLSACHKFSSRT